MACFTISAAAGIGVAVARHLVKRHENKLELEGKTPKIEKFGSDIKWSKKLAYLELGLFSGSFLLAVEHIIHGEVTMFPPFLTAMRSAEETATMLQEMGTVGVAMLAIIVATWGIATFIVDFFKYRKRKQAKQLEGAK